MPAGEPRRSNFAPALFDTPQTIILTQGQLELSDTTGTETITGPAAGVTISGGGQSRVFQVDQGVTASISGVTITGGQAAGDGGGLYNSGTTTLTDCTVSDNSAGSGGGMATSGSGTTTLTDCTVSGNTASSEGGGLYNLGTSTLTDCTVSGNTAGNGVATAKGGGIYNSGLLTLTGSTITGNQRQYGTTTPAYGGGIFNSGTLTVTSSTIAAQLRRDTRAAALTTPRRHDHADRHDRRRQYLHLRRP